MSPSEIAVTTGIVVSLVFTYFPKLRVKFAELDPDSKRAVVAASLLIVTLALFGGSCFKVIDTSIVCDKSGLLNLLSAYVTAALSSQGAYLLAPQPADVKAANAKPQA